MSDPFANLGRSEDAGTQPPSNLVTPASTSAPTPTTFPTTTSATTSTPTHPSDEQVMQPILVNILLEDRLGQFASAFELAGIVKPYHVTLLSADEVFSLKTIAGLDVDEPGPLGAINKKLWSGMIKFHDRLQIGRAHV